jgi:dihydroceramidase
VCAGHYQVTVYVAEFWNTISNLSMIIPPLYGVWNARKYALETRFFVSHLSLLLGE